MLNQVSLFTENNEGGLFKITTILAKANINIYTMLANDSAEFGIVRLIVDKAETAIEVLRAEGYQCRQDKVIAVCMTFFSSHKSPQRPIENVFPRYSNFVNISPSA